MGLRIVFVGHLRTKLRTQFRKLDSHGLIGRGVPEVVGRVVCERTESEGIFVRIIRLFDPVDDEVAAAHIVCEITEVLVSQWVIPRVLH